MEVLRQNAWPLLNCIPNQPKNHSNLKTYYDWRFTIIKRYRRHNLTAEGKNIQEELYLAKMSTIILFSI